MNDSILSPHKSTLPRLAIVGRPNVGKSTLFNRFAGKRRAITDPTPGVTRDSVTTKAMVSGMPVLLVDTGGYRVDAKDIDLLVREKSLEELKNADAILLVCDVEELNGEDESFVEHVRPYSDKVIVVVNKVDNPAREQQVWNFYNFGFKTVIGISAVHGYGFEELEDALFPILEKARGAEVEEEPRIKLAVLGKPNTGKSTLANRLIGEERSIVSDIPGTTRDLVEGRFSWHGSLYSIVDTAGIRRKRKVHENVEYYSVNRAIHTVDEADVVLLLIDSSEGLAEQDKKIAAQAVKRGKGIVLVLNKWDTIEDIPNRLEAVKDRVRFLFPVLSFAPLVPLSAKTGRGVDKLLETVYGVWRQLNKRVETHRFNEMLERWYEQYEPPRGKRGHFKILYGTQVSENPVHFVLFVNRKKDFPRAYVQYITNNIRAHLGFPSIPMTVELRERTRH
ncbi:MAG: ribosome biogenesis GTPase Der [Spirochaetaceae bacterium]